MNLKKLKLSIPGIIFGFVLVWLDVIFALIRPRNLNIVSNFMNHKIWGVCDYRRNFLRLQISFFKETEIFQHDYFIFSKSHNLGHQKKGFVATAEGWLPEVRHTSPELDQKVHITNHKIWACDYRCNFLRLQIGFCQRSLKSFSFLVSHMIWALA